MQDITICDETAPTEGRDIVVCPEEPIEEIEICLECTELFLFGPAEMEIGSVYTVTGGVSPYTFAISKGGFSQNGASITITSIDCQKDTTAVIEISVTDSCAGGAQTATLSVKQPGVFRVWRVFHDEEFQLRDENEQYYDGAIAYTTAKAEGIYSAINAAGCNSIGDYVSEFGMNLLWGTNYCLGQGTNPIYSYYLDNMVDYVSYTFGWNWTTQIGFNSCTAAVYDYTTYLPIRQDKSLGITASGYCESDDYNMLVLFHDEYRYVCE